MCQAIRIAPINAPTMPIAMSARRPKPAHDLTGEPTRKQANHQNDKKFLSEDGRFHRVEAAIGIIRGLKPFRHAVEVALDAAPTRRKPNAEAP